MTKAWYPFSAIFLTTLMTTFALALDPPRPSAEEEEAIKLSQEAGNIECSCTITGTCQFARGITSSRGHTKKECSRKLKHLLDGTHSVYKLGENPDDPEHFCKCEPFTYKRVTPPKSM